MGLRRDDDAWVVDHPVAQHALAQLRDAETDPVAFRRELTRLGRVCGYALAEERFETERFEVQTPLATASAERLAGNLVFVSILRAAVPFVEGLLDAVPQARQGMLSASRDEHAGMDAEGRFPVGIEYVKMPEIRPDDTVVVADPMLATGSTMVAALDEVLDETDPATAIVLSAVSAPAGIERVTGAFPAVEIVTASVDDRLDERGFIVPGLGDAGDRAFGTVE